MPSNGHFNGQPRWYRLFLPLSVAFLIHTLIIAGITHLLPATRPEPVDEVRFTLVKSGSDTSVKKARPAVSTRASVPDPAAQTQQSPAFRKFTIPPITTESSPQSAQPVQQDKQPDTNAKTDGTSQSQNTKKTVTKRRQRKPAASANSKPSEKSVSSTLSVTGQSTPTPTDAQAKNETPQISNDKSDDPYVAVLWEYISRELDRHPVARLRNLDRVRVLRMELRLLPSGVVRRVDIVKSSGNTALDAAARRSALSASPYPEPPNSAQNKGYRFQVELEFRPSRS